MDDGDPILGGSGERLLIIEDDEALCTGLTKALHMHGYQVLTAADGEQGMRRAFDDRPDLILLDIMLPGWSGLEILSALRERGEGTPVIILSAKGALGDKVQGLYLGADDYVTKPFDLPELLMRIAAKLRRVREELATEVLTVGELRIHTGGREVHKRGRPVELRVKEFDILYLLAKRPGHVFSRDEILNRVWGWDYEGTPRTVDNYIRNLRNAVEDDPERPQLIVTVRARGYKLDAEPGNRQ